MSCFKTIDECSQENMLIIKLSFGGYIKPIFTGFGLYEDIIGRG